MQKLINTNAKLCVVGLGYVGLPLAVEFSRHRNVVGYDVDPYRVSRLQSGFDDTLEVDGCDLKDNSSLHLTCDSSDLSDVGIFIVTVPTPVDSAKRPDLGALKSATQLVAEKLSVGALVIYESTVFPGCTDEICVPILESVSGLKFNDDFFCGYSPERINPGDREHTLRNVVKITSGSCPEAASAVDDLYSAIIDAGTFPASSISVAEAAKVIENTQRDLNIALVNELSVIFERLGIDTNDVLDAASTKWNFLNFKPGFVGGHCIGVDPYYLTHKAEMVNYNPQVILAGRRINDNMARYAARNVIKRMVQNNVSLLDSKVGVLGVTFKENCPDIRNTKVLDLVKELESWGVDVRISDPWADPDAVSNLFGTPSQKLELMEGLDAIIVAVPHDDFRSIPLEDFHKMTRASKPVFGDIKGVFPRLELASLGFTVFRL
jgi:UDP-N-acetyl-D-galactosamine dehydrogenase